MSAGWSVMSAGWSDSHAEPIMCHRHFDSFPFWHGMTTYITPPPPPPQTTLSHKPFGAFSLRQSWNIASPTTHINICNRSYKYNLNRCRYAYFDENMLVHYHNLLSLPVLTSMYSCSKTSWILRWVKSSFLHTAYDNSYLLNTTILF